jgi:phosphotriesterase-related protein
MDVMTVTGPVSGDDLGITLIHEHILFDGSWHHKPLSDPSDQVIGESPLRIETLGWARKYCYEHLDNSHRLDPGEAIHEVSFFKAAGGQTIVDQTPIGLGRDPCALRAIAEETGLHIVMGCGYYVHERHPASLRDRTLEEIANELVTDVTVGVGSSGVRSGLIGEIGVSDAMTDQEEKVLRAAARAQAITGVALSVHHTPWGRHAPRLVEIACEEGADPRRVIICHVDLDGRCDPEYYEAIANTGAYLAFDTFGHFDLYWYRRQPNPKRIAASDWDRVERIAGLIEAGWVNQIVLAQDVCVKVQLKRYGGFGFDHLLESGIPMLRSLGVSDADVRTMLVDNPRRVLTGVEGSIAPIP